MKADIITAIIIIIAFSWATYVTLDAMPDTKVIKRAHNEWPL